MKCESNLRKMKRSSSQNVFWLLVKLLIFISDSKNAIKIAPPEFKRAEQASFKSLKKFGQKWPIFEMVKILLN